VGAQGALASLRDWRPDLLYNHRLFDLDLERETLHIAPAIFFAHDYNGACLSGTKTFQAPKAMPCTRPFDWKCFLHYYPHRCGGLSPVTMLKEYRRQSKRQEILRDYQCTLTNSDYVQAELSRYGLNVNRIYLPIDTNHSSGEIQVKTTHWRLLFLGRMSSIKGGKVFIDALPEVSAALQRPIHVTFAGDGPERQAWERKAARVESLSKEIRIDFVGWVDDLERETILSKSDLLIVPSLWPEPFGLVGPEAGMHGVPAVAFDVGGIPEWLLDGINGFLAPGDHPTSSGLAQAIIKALRDYSTYEGLRRGALESAQRFSMKQHLIELMNTFEDVASHS
jgi:glycosyltransferase involved in cell wall biosynthesis